MVNTMYRQGCTTSDTNPEKKQDVLLRVIHLLCQCIADPLCCRGKLFARDIVRVPEPLRYMYQDVQAAIQITCSTGYPIGSSS